VRFDRKALLIRSAAPGNATAAHARGLAELRILGLLRREGHEPSDMLGWLSLTGGPQRVDYGRRIM
jgi:hypothetical protein